MWVERPLLPGMIRTLLIRLPEHGQDDEFQQKIRAPL